MDGKQLVPLSGVSWLAATLAPWTISPHPNFGSDILDGPALLALVAEYRGEEIDRFSENADLELPAWASRLVESAKNSLISETQRRSADELRELASDASLPFGARAAAALFATVAYVEVDELGSSIDLLRAMNDELEQSSDHAPSSIVIENSIRLQLAVRLFESGQFDEVTDLLQAIEASLLRPDEEFEYFRVSKGISWNSHRVHLDIVDATVSHATNLRVRLEGFSGTAWVNAVKSRPAWIDVRIDWRHADRDARFRKQVFESQAPAQLGRVTYGGEGIPGIRAALGSLLLAELNGDYGEILANREALAQILALGRDQFDAHESMFEALRLMRTAKTKEGLRAMITLARSDGPVSALVDAANSVIGRESFPDDCSASDARLLEGASDLVPTRDASRVLAALCNYLDRRDRTSSFEEIRLGVRTIAAYNSSEFDARRVAQSVIGAIGRTGTSPYSVASEIARLLDSFTTFQLKVDSLEEWRSWATKLLEDDDTRKIGRQILYKLGIGSAENGEPAYSDDESLVDFLTRSDVSAVPGPEIKTIVDHTIESLRTMTREAHAGIRTGYFRDPGEVAALIAFRTGDEDLWTAIDAVLSDMLVSADHKARMVERLSQRASEIPEKFANAIRTYAGQLFEQPRAVSPLAFETRSIFPEALGLACRLQAVPADTALTATTDLANDTSPTIRQEACRIIPAVIEGLGTADWGQVVLLQLSKDPNLVVRADAVRELAVTLPFSRSLLTIVADRLTHVLDSDSVRMPLFVLHGLQQIEPAQLRSEDFIPVTSKLARLSLEHPSATVRGAADLVIEALYGES